MEMIPFFYTPFKPVSAVIVRLTFPISTQFGEEDVRECYQKLSEGGQKSHPLELSFYGGLFGGLTDKYGNRIPSLLVL